MPAEKFGQTEGRTDRESRADRACGEGNPFIKIGTRPITVEIIYVVRASSDSFEIRWKDHTYENAGILKTDRFTAVANVQFRSPNTTKTISRNPLGLYINTFTWWCDSAGAGVK